IYVVLEAGVVEGCSVGSDPEAHIHVRHPLDANGNLQCIPMFRTGTKIPEAGQWVEENKRGRRHISGPRFLFRSARRVAALDAINLPRGCQRDVSGWPAAAYAVMWR